MTLEEVTKLKQRCVRALDDSGVPSAVRKFCLEVVEYEEETAAATLRMHEKLHHANSEEVESLESLRQLIQSMTNDFTSWNQTVDNLVASGSSLPPLQVTRLQDRKIQALSSIQTKQLQIEGGDRLTVIDTSQPNVIKVRTRDGKEDFVPILICILPCSDKTVSSLLQRLLVQLLSSWTDCLSQSGKSLLRSTKDAFSSLNLAEHEMSEVEMNGSSIISKLKKLHDVVKCLEGKLSLAKTSKDIVQKKKVVASLLKSFNAYLLFFEYWNNFRLQLKGRKPRPICIFENLEDFKHHVANNKQLRYYTTTFTVESTEIREETVHVPGAETEDDASSYGGGGFWKQLVETEQLTSTSQEEKKRYIIRAVKDPRTEQNISLQEAIQSGIIDMKRGLYINPKTLEAQPIALALTDHHIEIDYVTKTRSVPKTEALGLITIRDRIESRKYTITAVVDPMTAEKVDLKEAKKRGLLDSDATGFFHSTSGDKIDMDDAIESGWVLVEYDSEEATEDNEFQTKTYAVRAVVDQRLKKRVPFLEAVQRRLIDRETGNFYNNLSGETIHAVEAIRRGFLKAKLIEDPTKLDIDPHNKNVVQGINKMKNMVTGLSALTAMKESVNRTSTSSTRSASSTSSI